MSREYIAQYFDQSYTMSNDPVQAVGWYSAETQVARFDALVTIGNIADTCILDVGCGLGDFYGYTENGYQGVTYTGIDLAENMVRQAKKRYQEAVFLQKDLMELDTPGEFDYVFSSGAFNLRLDDNYEYVQRSIEHMWLLSKRGVAFNLLSSYAPVELRDSIFFYYAPERIFPLCKELAPYVIVRHDYLPNDVTFILIR